MNSTPVTVRKYSYLIPWSEEWTDDGAWFQWFLFRGTPGYERQAQAARKQILQAGGGLGAGTPALRGHQTAATAPEDARRSPTYRRRLRAARRRHGRRGRA